MSSKHSKPQEVLRLQHQHASLSLVLILVLFLVMSAVVVVAVEALSTTTTSDITAPSATITVVANCSAHPTSALSTARDHVRSLQPLTTDVTVLVIGVCREPLLLDARRDSGVLLTTTTTTPGAPITTITYRGSGESTNPPGVISGGVDIPLSKFSPLSRAAALSLPFPFPSRVVQVNLTELYGLTQSDFGDYSNGGLGQCGHTVARLYVQDAPMIRARSPNAHGMEPPTTSQVPWTSWDYPLVLPPNTSNTFISNGTSNFSAIAAAFANPDLAEVNANVWAHGYWAYDWADNYVRIQNISKLSPTAALSAPYQVFIDPATPPIYELTAGNQAGRFYLLNHPAFLDAPGEYFIDVASGMLYVIPPTNDTETVFTLSVQSSPLIHQVNTTDNNVPLTHVTIDTIAVIYGRANAIQIDNSNFLHVNNINIFGFTQGAVSAAGNNITVNQCTLSQLGCSGVAVYGGNPTTLIDAHNVVSNNQITNYAQLTRSYSHGVYVGGVGVQVHHNFIFNAPHQGISASGNNHVFSLNTLMNLCYGTIDAGAFYIGRSWVNRGMVLADNTFDNIFIQEPVAHVGTMVSAIYWDDQQSGVTATGNRIRNVDNCFLVGGGRDNNVIGNLCINSAHYMVYFDNRGMNWQEAMCTPPNGQLVEQLIAVNFTHPPYSTAYPRIVTTLTDSPCVPVGNVFADNVFSGVRWGFCSQDNATIAEWKSTSYNNTEI